MPEPSKLDHNNLSIFNDVDWIITDCDGVLWLEKKLIEGTPEFFSRMRSQGKKIIFATNNNSKSRESLLNKLNSFGFNASLDEVMVTSYSVAVYLKNLPFNGKVYVLGTSVLRKEIEKVGIRCCQPSQDESDSIHDDRLDYDAIKIDPDVGAMVVGMDYRLNTAKIIKACTYATRVPPHLMIATNKDSTFPASGNILVPGTGAYVELIEKVAGRPMISLGKPERFFFDCIKKIHPDIDPSKSIMIGDRLDTDILFGHNNKIKYTLLVGTGVNNMGDVEKRIKNGEHNFVPTHYLPKLSDLNQYFK